MRTATVITCPTPISWLEGEIRTRLRLDTEVAVEVGVSEGVAVRVGVLVGGGVAFWIRGR